MVAGKELHDQSSIAAKPFLKSCTGLRPAILVHGISCPSLFYTFLVPLQPFKHRDKVDTATD